MNAVKRVKQDDQETPHRMDLQDNQVLRVCEDLRDNQVKLVSVEKLVYRALADNQAIAEREDREDLLDLKVPRDKLVHQDQQDHEDKADNPGKEDNQELQDKLVRTHCYPQFNPIILTFKFLIEQLVPVQRFAP